MDSIGTGQAWTEEKGKEALYIVLEARVAGVGRANAAAAHNIAKNPRTSVSVRAHSNKGDLWYAR